MTANFVRLGVKDRFEMWIQQDAATPHNPEAAVNANN
jgi:hypothetical protein